MSVKHSCRTITYIIIFISKHRSQCAYFVVDLRFLVSRINYRLINRTKPKTTHTPLMPNGAPLSVVNGYTQTLIQNFPQYTRQYTSWLTRGLKVQSFRSGARAQPEYSHSRPPPPLIQYIHRPKTVSSSSRWPSRRGRTGGAINIVGVNTIANTAGLPTGSQEIKHAARDRLQM